MRILGIVAEYDPFHGGHAWHLAEARRRAEADYVVVVMSTCFTQRGEAALVPPADRAAMALAGGADAVVALPACWALRDAEHFALGGVHLLHALGADCIAFGAESDDLRGLQALARAIEVPPPSMLAAIHGRLDAGQSYPSALHGALTLLMPEHAPLLASPNNTLAVCYLRAMLRLGADMTPVLIPRTGAYHDPSLSGGLSSATAVRGALRRGDWDGVARAVPPTTLRVLREAALSGRVMPAGGLDQALLYRLRTMSGEAWAALPGLSEGIEDRLRAAAQTAATREALLLAAKTRRYPYARLSRLCAHALLQITQDQLDDTPLPPAAWLLGFRTEARPLLHRMKQGTVPLIAKAAAWDRQQPWFRTELLAYDLWALGCGLPAGMGLTQGIVRLEPDV